jgi:hypothetical protein
MPAQMTFPIEAPSSNGSAPQSAAAPALEPRRLPSEQRRAVIVNPDPPPTPVAPSPASDAPDRPARHVDGVLVSIGLCAVRVAAALHSYEHMRYLAITAGEGWRSWTWPISVDALAVVALVKIRRARRLGHPCGMAWVALVLSLGVSLAANVAAAQPTPVGRLVAAWPPIALLLAEVVDTKRRDGVSGTRPLTSEAA